VLFVVSCFAVLWCVVFVKLGFRYVGDFFISLCCFIQVVLVSIILNYVRIVCEREYFAMPGSLFPDSIELANELKNILTEAKTQDRFLGL
jgi:hypothetical protein